MVKKGFSFLQCNGRNNYLVDAIIEGTIIKDFISMNCPTSFIDI